MVYVGFITKENKIEKKKKHLSSNEQEKKEYDLMYSIKICLY